MNGPISSLSSNSHNESFTHPALAASDSLSTAVQTLLRGSGRANTESVGSLLVYSNETRPTLQLESGCLSPSFLLDEENVQDDDILTFLDA